MVTSLFWENYVKLVRRQKATIVDCSELLCNPVRLISAVLVFRSFNKNTFLFSEYYSPLTVNGKEAHSYSLSYLFSVCNLSYNKILYNEHPN